MKWFFLSPALKKLSPAEPPFTALERQQRESMAQALRYLEPVMASDDLAECHHRMALAASLLRAILGRNYIGSELNPLFVDEYQRRVGKPLQMDLTGIPLFAKAVSP